MSRNRERSALPLKDEGVYIRSLRRRAHYAGVTPSTPGCLLQISRIQVSLVARQNTVDLWSRGLPNAKTRRRPQDKRADWCRRYYEAASAGSGGGMAVTPVADV